MQAGRFSDPPSAVSNETPIGGPHVVLPFERLQKGRRPWQFCFMGMLTVEFSHILVYGMN